MSAVVLALPTPELSYPPSFCNPYTLLTVARLLSFSIREIPPFEYEGEACIRIPSSQLAPAAHVSSEPSCDGWVAPLANFRGRRLMREDQYV